MGRSWSRLAFAAPASALTACSLFTSLDGFTGGADPSEAGPDVIADAAPDADASTDAPVGAIAWRDTQNTYVGNGAQNAFEITKPTGTTADDLLVGVLFIGQTGSTSVLPVITAPSGWSLLRRVDHQNVSSLAIYLRKAGPDEPATYRFDLDRTEEGVAWISAYSGVDDARPVSADIPADVDGPGISFNTPAITADPTGAWLVGAVVGHGTTGSWSAPATAATRFNHDNENARSGIGFDLAVPTGKVPPMTATFSATENYALTHVLVLRPK